MNGTYSPGACGGADVGCPVVPPEGLAHFLEDEPSAYRVSITHPNGFHHDHRTLRDAAGRSGTR